MDGKRETTISYVKMWFIIQLEQPFIDGCLGYQIEEIRRYLWIALARRIAIPPPLASKLVETWTSQKMFFVDLSWIELKGGRREIHPGLETETSQFVSDLFQLDDSKCLHEKWVFHHFHPLKKMVVWSWRPEDDNLREFEVWTKAGVKATDHPHPPLIYQAGKEIAAPQY